MSIYMIDGEDWGVREVAKLARVISKLLSQYHYASLRGLKLVLAFFSVRTLESGLNTGDSSASSWTHPAPAALGYAEGRLI